MQENESERETGNTKRVYQCDLSGPVILHYLATSKGGICMCEGVHRHFSHTWPKQREGVVGGSSR